MQEKLELVRKSIGASILISLGCYSLLKMGSPIGPVLFTLGLLGVCYMGQNLFTGKCGFIIQDKIKALDLLIILIVNLISGYLIGLMYSYTDPEIFKNAVEKVSTWEFSLPFFIKGCMCGVIMYICVDMYKKGTPLGIIFGIPLFIFCGFQHCIANVITMGVARAMDPSLILAIIGNFVGSLVMWYVSKDAVKKVTKRRK